MKKILIFTVLLGFFMPMGLTYATELEIYSSPSWTELEVAAERAGVEINRQRPIEYKAYIKVLTSYVEILKERVLTMGLVPVSNIQVSNVTVETSI